MMLARHAVRMAVLVFAAAGLDACGGGGSGSGAAPPPPPAWVQGQFEPESKFAAMCVTPRTGIDPGTQKPYPDVQGTLLDELNWLRSWNNDLYLWFDEVVDQNPANFSTDAAISTSS
jgi:carboxyl-terminal processing protease